jgi:choline dehydrogenase
VLPCFKVHERNERLAHEFHGIDGELNVADQVQHDPMSQAFMRAAQESGIRRTDDPNGASQEGVCVHQVTQRKARRESASTAFLHPVMNRPNLPSHSREVSLQPWPRAG